MLVIEYKVKAKPNQYKAIDEAIRTVQFIRNKCLRHWMDSPKSVKIDRFVLNKYSTELRNEFPFVKELNSMAVQASAERGWLEYFATKFGKLAIAVPPHCTSQECSQCQRVVKKSLSTRIHICQCGCILHRDWNAALNILRKARSTLGHKESNALGDGISTLLGENLVEQILSMIKESPCL